MENISKVYEKLLSLKSTKLILDDGRGRKLYDVSVSPAFRTKYFKYGLPQRTDGFELKTKSDITGNAYDRGWILIDNRQQLKDRQSNPKNRNNEGVTMATKKFSPAQIAAQKLFAERARAGTLGKGKLKAAVKRKANPGLSNQEMIDNFAKKLIRRVKHRMDDFGDSYSKAKAMVSLESVAGESAWAVVDKYFEGAKRKTNPDKSKPRAYVKRASQATGAPPSKRLLTRRKKALSAPAGYFPNPKVKYTNRAKDLKGEQRVGYSVHMADAPSYLAIAWFSKKSDAVQVAQEASDRTGKQLAVTRVQNHFGPL